MDLATEIILIGVANAVISIFIQRLLIDMTKVYEHQNMMKTKLDEHKELMKRSDVSKEELDAKQKEIMFHATQSMKHQLKPLIVLTPLSIILYSFVLPWQFGAAASGVTFWGLNYQHLFIVATIITGLVVSNILLNLDAKKMEKQKQAQQQLQPQIQGEEPKM